MGDNVTNTANTGNTLGLSSSNIANSTQTAKDPWAAALPWLQNVAGQADINYGSSNLSSGVWAQGGDQGAAYRQGQNFLADNPNGITSQMQAPLSQLGGVASGANGITTGNMYQHLYDQAQPLAGNTSGALTDTQQQILSDNADRIAARQASLYSGAGRYGSEGAGIGMARGIAETNNPLMAQYSQQNIGNALNAMGVQQGAAGGLSNVQQQNIGNQMNAANSQLNNYNQGIQNMQRQQALQPSLMNLAISPWTAGWQNAQNYAQTIGSMYPMLANAGTITTNGNASTTGTNINNTTGSGQTSTPTPWTTYAGLGLAGIGALSDVRAKTDIELVGTDPTGLNMYKYRYKGQPKSVPKFVGPMAQEVAQRDPGAVGREPWTGLLYLKGQR